MAHAVRYSNADSRAASRQEDDEEHMTAKTLGQSWYAIRTRSRHEKVVRDQLAGRGIEPLLPLCISISQWKDRKKTIQLPLFPGYCFAKFALADRMPVLQAPGVIEIVGQAQCPEPVSPRDIEIIKALVESSHRYESHPYLQEGAMVEVIHGPFLGLRGHLLRKANRCRLVVAVHIIRQAASIEINADDVMPISMPVA